MTTSGGTAIHAGAVVVGEAGILVRGPSGSGKSTLARALVHLAEHGGTFASLVGDDRMIVVRRNGRLVARCHPGLGGLLEVRGVGIVRARAEPACVIRLVVECGFAPPRLPDEDDRHVTVEGVRLARLAVGRGTLETAFTVLSGLRGLDDTLTTVPCP